MDQKEALEAQEEAQSERQMRQIAAAQAGQNIGTLRGNDPEFLELLGEPDVATDDPDDDLEQVVATETSRLNMLSSLTDEEVAARAILNQNLAMRIKSEFIPATGPGSKCVGEYRAIVTGEESEENRPQLSSELERRIDGAVGEEGVRTNQQALARDGKALDAVTQIQTAVFGGGGGGGSSGSSGSSPSGAIGKAKSFLLGGS